MSEIQFNKGVIRPVECYKEAWELIKNRFWLLLALVIVGGFIGAASMYILLGAMVCGIFYCYLRVIDRKDFKFEDLFKGFGFWLPGLIVAIFFVVPMFVLYALIYIPPLIAITTNPNITQEELLTIIGASFVVDAIFMVFMVCLHTLLMFSFPLIVDKNLSAFAAMKTSAKAVWANLSGVAGLWGLGFLLSLAGILVFCIGIYLAVPLMIGANMLAYRKVFPASPNV
ncbi:MAG TPA: hypothetical protein PKE69_08600 [Pyrinomonadaceae bacterium]|nr:hypothetical protein [Pyrinomonadaceae bacterium]